MMIVEYQNSITDALRYGNIFDILNEKKKLSKMVFCSLAVTWFHLKTSIIVFSSMQETHMNAYTNVKYVKNSSGL